MTGWMIDNDDPARLEIVERAKALGITGTPDKAAHALGAITLAGGRVVQAHVVHAVDPIITDGIHVVMINRLNEPGKGKPALPGGFIDPTKGGGVESAIQAAAREAMEEAGIDLGNTESTLVGTRNMNRPFDVRIAGGDGLKGKYGISAGDVFMVSTQAVRFYVADLINTTLIAGDDAAPGSARRVRIDSLNRDAVGIPDHFDMIMAANLGSDTPAATEKTPSRQQRIGDRMEDGTIYAGISPETDKPMYTTARDAPLTMRWYQAMEYASSVAAHGHRDWRVPTKDELSVLFSNRAAIGGFVESGSGAARWHWSSTHGKDDEKAWAQLFSDGQSYYDTVYDDCSLRIVR
jgi:hypothetical protein